MPATDLNLTSSRGCRDDKLASWVYERSTEAVAVVAKRTGSWRQGLYGLVAEWQTRLTQNQVPKGVWVQVPPGLQTVFYLVITVGDFHIYGYHRGKHRVSGLYCYGHLIPNMARLLCWQG